MNLKTIITLESIAIPLEPRATIRSTSMIISQFLYFKKKFPKMFVSGTIPSNKKILVDVMISKDRILEVVVVRVVNEDTPSTSPQQIMTSCS